jgi:hypothetical protein
MQAPGASLKISWNKVTWECYSVASDANLMGRQMLGRVGGAREIGLQVLKLKTNLRWLMKGFLINRK